MADDIYTSEHLPSEHSLHYIHVVIRNTLGIVNRITSLLRRKRYFIEEITVSFDEEGLAHVIFSIDGNAFDIQQVMRQLRKLHDVLEVYDTTETREQIYHSIFVRSKDKNIFTNFPEQPLTILQELDDFIGVFVIAVESSLALEQWLIENEYPYVRRLTSLK